MVREHVEVFPPLNKIPGDVPGSIKPPYQIKEMCPRRQQQSEIVLDCMTEHHVLHRRAPALMRLPEDHIVARKTLSTVPASPRCEGAEVLSYRVGAEDLYGFAVPEIS